MSTGMKRTIKGNVRRNANAYSISALNVETGLLEMRSSVLTYLHSEISISPEYHVPTFQEYGSPGMPLSLNTIKHDNIT